MYHILLTTQKAVKLEGLEPYVYIYITTEEEDPTQHLALYKS